MFDVSYKLTDYFFDKQSVVDKLSKSERKAMAKIGAHIRRAARSSIRRRKGASKPGSPPSAHSTDKVATLKNILFGYSPSEHNVIVGPVKLNQANRADGQNTPLPAVMEFGGTLSIREERWKSTRNKEYKWRRRDLRRLPSENKEYRVRQARYAPRPFMGPALEKERKSNKLIDAWREIL